MPNEIVPLIGALMVGGMLLIVLRLLSIIYLENFQ